MKQILLTTLASLSLLGAGLIGNAQAAGSSSFSLSPASGSHVNGSAFSVSVYENGSAVNVVTAKLSYDTSKLTCTSAGGSSSFPSTVEASCANGSVTITRYTAPGTTLDGDQLVGSINFTAIASSGVANVNFASGSQIASAGANTWNGNTAGGSYTMTAPAASAPGQGSAGGSTTTGGTTGSTAKSSAAGSAAAPAVAGAATSQPSANATSSSTAKSGSVKAATASKTLSSKHFDGALWGSVAALAVLLVGTGVYYYKRPRATVVKAKKA